MVIKIKYLLEKILFMLVIVEYILILVYICIKKFVWDMYYNKNFLIN